jgi:hypothetical protein
MAIEISIKGETSKIKIRRRKEKTCLRRRKEIGGLIMIILLINIFNT